jgi:hypothetical protein
MVDKWDSPLFFSFLMVLLHMDMAHMLVLAFAVLVVLLCMANILDSLHYASYVMELLHMGMVHMSVGLAVLLEQVWLYSPSK